MKAAPGRPMPPTTGPFPPTTISMRSRPGDRRLRRRWAGSNEGADRGQRLSRALERRPPVTEPRAVRHEEPEPAGDHHLPDRWQRILGQREHRRGRGVAIKAVNELGRLDR